MNEIDSKVEELVETIKHSSEYTRYCKALAKLQEYPEIEREANEFRKKSYEIQKQKNSNHIFDEMVHLQDEYASLRRNPMVEEYLTSELAVCRVFQNINWKIIRDLNFQIGFEDEM